MLPTARHVKNIESPSLAKRGKGRFEAAGFDRMDTQDVFRIAHYKKRRLPC